MTTFTKYGKALAAQEDVPAPDPLGGATASMKAMQHDSGISVLLFGRDSSGKPFTKSAKSVFGAWFTARAAWGINTAWHLRDDNTRRLIFRR